MLLHRIKLKNVLSFGPDAPELELKPLNVLIGPNGSGKSNLIETIGLLKAAPKELCKLIIDEGGVSDWIWGGKPTAPSVEVEAVVEIQDDQLLRYRLAFTGRHFKLIDERLEDEHADSGRGRPHVYFESDGTEAALSYIKPVEDTGRGEIPETGQPGETSSTSKEAGGAAGRSVSRLRPMNHQESILHQVRDPLRYPELTRIAKEFERIRLYREWFFGRHTPARIPQKADNPNDALLEDGRNLGLVLNRLMQNIEIRQRILSALRNLYEGLTDIHVNVEYGAVQVFLHEGNISVPATRLSDGTIRYLCLLVILCEPNPPPLICLEEPELGLHPDILPGLGDLLCEASERCQLIVTTHSDVLVDKLTDSPDSVVVCEKHEGQTRLQRLDKDELAGWLERYSLGDLWTRGGLGGNRW